MNNLHRELAPISDAAWARIQEEARRTFEQHVAARRVVAWPAPTARPCPASAPATSPRSTRPPTGSSPGAHSQPLVQLRVPFTLCSQDVDDVERGRKGPTGNRSRTRPRVGFAEDRAASRDTGRRDQRDQEELVQPGAGPARRGPGLPERGQPGGEPLRLAGVGGPFWLLLSADAYTMVSDSVTATRSAGTWPASSTGRSIGAPAIDGESLRSGRGGDLELRLGQDLSIGYLSHDADTVQLYFQESQTFLVYTSEAIVSLTAGA